MTKIVMRLSDAVYVINFVSLNFQDNSILKLKTNAEFCSGLKKAISVDKLWMQVTFSSFVYESELQKELQPIWEASTDNCRYLSSHGV